MTLRISGGRKLLSPPGEIARPTASGGRLAVVDLVCDDVIVLQHGRVVEQGPADRVLRQPDHPYTQRLLAALPGQPGAATGAESPPTPPLQEP